jgi:hypothetical protein
MAYVMRILRALVPALAALALGACGSGTQVEEPVAVAGLVTDASGVPVADATVFAVPASAIDTTTPMTATSIREGASDGVDEPLEDAIDRDGKQFPRARTDDEGRFSLRTPATTAYFVYVTPASEDEVLPGGSLARKAQPARELAAAPLKIRLSSRPPREATVIGSAACLSCHATQDGWKRTPHALGVTALDQPSALQDYDLASAGWRAGVLAAFPESGTRTVYFTPKPASASGHDCGEEGEDECTDEGGGGHGGGQDSYLVREAEPQNWAFKAVLTREAGVPVMTLVDNPASAVVAPSKKFSVTLVMGGQGNTQRFLTRVAAPGNPAVTEHFGLPFKVQFEGDEAADTGGGTRGYFRGDHAERWVTVDASADVTAFKLPGAKSSFEASCAACHVLDYRLDRDAATGFFTARAFPTEDGIPYGASGERRELDVGCEVCHGPGSDHQAAYKSRPGAFIVSPGLLSAEREVQICTQCHSRIRSNDTFGLGTRQPIGREPGRENELMRPGTRRAEWFRYYVMQRDAEASLIWEDDLHSKHPHQQATDYVKSVHYRNRTELVACSSCHSPHARGPAGWARGTRPGEVMKPSTVCLACHSGNLAGVAEHERHRDQLLTACESCHMPRTARDGAGRPGLLGSLHGTEGRFWEGDLASHVFDVPTRGNAGVAAEGKVPATAMPIPYTNGCGTACHVANEGR